MSVTGENKRRIQLDTILIEEIGQFGKYQARTWLLAVIVAMFVAWTSMGFVFTTGRINTRCMIPECDNDQPQWSPYWLVNAVPVNSQGEFDNCLRYESVTNSSALRVVDSETCPYTLFNRDVQIPCEGYVYENTDTVVYSFDLGCDEWRRALIGTMRTLGAVLFMPVSGYISDRWGRRVALSIAAFNTAWLGCMRYFANTYVGYMLSEIAEASLGAGSYTSAYILMIELIGPKYRVAAGATMNTFFSIGGISLGAIAWALPYWRDRILALYVPQLLTISLFWLASESVRWYMSKGKFEDSEALLKKVAKVNGKPLSAKSLQALRQNAVEEAKNKDNVSKEWLIVTVFKHKQILIRCLVAPFWWITSTFISYGLSFNAVNISGNQYLNFMLVSAAEIPGQWISVFLLKRIGRKPVLITAFWLCATFQIAYIFMPQGWYALSLTMYLLSQTCIAMELVAIYIYTAELYPTVKRQTLFSFTSMIGRVGNMLAPLTPAFSTQWFENLPFVLFASLAIIAGGLVFLTPETRGTKLPDTFEEAESIGQNHTNTENS